MALANKKPQDVFNYKVKFSTTKLSNGNVFSEPHTVTDPTGTFTIPLNFVKKNGNPFGPITVIPISSNTGNGAYFIKLHMPQPNESEMYITFCQKNPNMTDGYYDYIQGIPSDFRNQLRGWIRDGKINLPSGGETLSKKIKFKVKGIDTNVSSASVEFTVMFSASFGSVSNS